MGVWSDVAAWRGPTSNKGGAMTQQRGCVVHIAEGTYEGTISWQRNDSSNVSSHFIVARTGAIAQMVDTEVTAWTQSAGNGKWISIENEGFTPASVHYRQGWEILTSEQIEANARILAKGHKVYGYPLQLAVDPNGRGLGHHSMGCRWPGGAWGHCDCPGPAIIAQKQQILDRAIDIVNGGGMAARNEENADNYLWRVVTLADSVPGIKPYDGSNVTVTIDNLLAKAVKSLLAAATADETRDRTMLAAIQALAGAGGPEAAPIVNAIKAEGEATRALVEQRHQVEMAELRRAFDAEKAGLQAELDRLNAAPQG